MKKNKIIIGNFIGISIILIVWSILAHKINIFPSISQIIYQICTILVNNYVINSIFTTFFRAIIAFVISLLLGIIFANISFYSKIFKSIVAPIISLLRSIPTISLILIVILVVKIELITYIIVFIISFPIIYQTILFSLNNIDRELLLINKLDNCSSLKNYFMFILPMSYDGILNAILQTFGLSLKVQIMSELLTGSTKIQGIGFLLNYYKTTLDLDSLIVITILVIIIVYIIECILKYILKRIQK